MSVVDDACFQGKEGRWTHASKKSEFWITQGAWCYLIPPALSAIHKAYSGCLRLAGV